MALTLYLARHGETDYNRLRRVQGRSIDAPLNPTGTEQAQRLAARFTDVALDAVYTSALQRTHQTVAPLLEHRPGMMIHHWADLDEMDWGIWEGRESGPETRAAFLALQARWAAGDFAYRIRGGESILDVQGRALDAFARIRTSHPDGSVLVVTHGRWLRVLLASILPEVGLAAMQTIQHANTGLNKLYVMGDALEVAYLNCTRHLDALE